MLFCRAVYSSSIPPPKKPKQLFTVHSNVQVDLSYVLTVYETCHRIDDIGEKYQMYLNYGLDGDMVEQYLDTVIQLNRLIKKKPKDEGTV